MQEIQAHREPLTVVGVVNRLNGRGGGPLDPRVYCQLGQGRDERIENDDRLASNQESAFTFLAVVRGISRMLGRL